MCFLCHHPPAPPQSHFNLSMIHQFHNFLFFSPSLVLVGELCKLTKTEVDLTCPTFLVSPSFFTPYHYSTFSFPYYWALYPSFLTSSLCWSQSTCQLHLFLQVSNTVLSEQEDIFPLLEAFQYRVSQY